MSDQQLTDADIETRLSWLLTLPPLDPILIRPMTEIRELRELKAARAHIEELKPYFILCKIRAGEFEDVENKEADDWSCTGWMATR